MVMLLALTLTSPETSLESNTSPGVAKVTGPAIGVSEVPAGTPVFDAPGHAGAGLGVGRAGVGVGVVVGNGAAVGVGAAEGVATGTGEGVALPGMTMEAEAVGTGGVVR